MNEESKDVSQEPKKRVKRDYSMHVSGSGSRPIVPKRYSLSMKGTIYLDYIMSGKKEYEGRVCAATCQKMKVGDELKLFDRNAHWGIICTITSIDQYRGFEEMLKAKGVVQMLPQLESKAISLSREGLLREGVKIYEAFPGSHRVHEFGAVAIGVKFVEKIYS